MQLIMINADAQCDNEITPAKHRVIKIKISQYIRIPAFVECTNFRMQVSYFRCEYFKRSGFPFLEARRPQETDPLRKFWTSVQIFDLGFVWARSAKATIPAVQFPKPSHSRVHGSEQQKIVIENFANSPFFANRPLPELGFG